MTEGQYYCECKKDNVIHRGVLTLKENDGVLSGIMFPATSFWQETVFGGGKMQNGSFSFSAYWGTPCQQYSMDVCGKSDGDNITGSCMTPEGLFSLTGYRIDMQESEE